MSKHVNKIQTLEPPFATLITVPSPKQQLSHSAENLAATAPVHHTLPATIRRGTTLVRITEDLDYYYITELGTDRLNDIRSCLWLAGHPGFARPLHRQHLVGREIILTENPDEHLVWHETRIFIKPLPIFLLDYDCWVTKICRDKKLYEAALGFLLSYVWLVRHESDLRIAHDKGLLPTFMSWAAWTKFTSEFLEHIDLQSLKGISPRYHYGELRLSRLNKIYVVARFSWNTFLRGYMSTSTWYQDFFSRNFAWLLAVYALASVALTAMQVVLATPRSEKTLENISYGFSVFSLFFSAGTVFAIFVVWLVLFVYHLASATLSHRRVLRERAHAENHKVRSA